MPSETESMFLPDQALTNLVWGRLTALTLERLGLTNLVVSPGSRSTPLVLGFAAEGRIRMEPVLDERSAGFLALGMARATDRPVALLCTSGSAVANFLPAVVEASEACIPLIVLTADRPPELQDCGAGQTIHQPGIFGPFARLVADLPPPGERDAPWAYLVRTLERLWHTSLGPKPGPVQANFPFREPLLPAPADFPGPALPGLLRRLCPSPAARLASPTSVADDPEPDLPLPAPMVDRSVAKEKVLVIGGHWAGPGGALWFRRVRELAGHLGWPVLADVLTPWRHQGGAGLAIATYDLILRQTDRLASFRPDRILQVGALPTSKILRQTLAAWRSPRWILDPYRTNPNPDHSPAVFLGRGENPVEWEEFVRNAPRGNDDYGRLWYGENLRASVYLQEEGSKAPVDFEGRLYPLLAGVLPAGSSLMVASSTPVRDAEWFWPVTDKQFRIFANRGANGIDGTLSTAVGLARAVERPLFLVTGDLALLHDANGILAATALQDSLSLTIILINNEGGGIFQNLPIAQYGSLFERLFATPQQINWPRWASAFGLPYAAPEGDAAWREALAEAPAKGVRLLEWRTSRGRDARVRKEILRGFAHDC